MSAAAMAHDLANVLAAIDAVAEEALAHGTADAAALAEIRRYVARGAALVAAATAAVPPAPPPALSVPAAVADLAPMLRRLAGPGVALHVAPGGGDAAARIDAVAFERMLTNLVANARDAMPDGGAITLRAGCADGDAVIEVTDTGAGIASALLGRVFEPSVTSKGRGRGRGLATVRALARAAGGEAAAENLPGAGARFTIRLPLADAAPSSVLLVEDEEPVRRAAARGFERAGWRVREAASAEEAAALLAAEPPALLVCDLSLPGTDGMALLRRALATAPGLRAILMSGYADAGLQSDCAALGIRFLAKPAPPGALLDAAAECLQARAGDVAEDRENI